MVEDRVAVALVEGDSDRAAVEELSRRLGRDPDEGSMIAVSMAGVANIGHYLKMYWKADRLAVLCDAGEADHVRRALERHPGDVGLFVCDADLEEELIRAVGVQRVFDVLDRQGDLAAFHTLQKQPDHRGAPVERQLHRFLGTRSGRKAQYARVLMAEVPIDDVPAPLADLMMYVLGGDAQPT